MTGEIVAAGLYHWAKSSCNEGKLCDSWDHCQIYTRIQEDKVTHLQEKRNLCGWQPETVNHKIRFMKKVMETAVRRVDEHLTTIQKYA